VADDLPTLDEAVGRLVRGELTRAEAETTVCRRGDGKLVRLLDVTEEDIRVHGAILEARLVASKAELDVVADLTRQVAPYWSGGLGDMSGDPTVPTEVRASARQLASIYAAWAAQGAGSG
jgi:hypothetical protein